MHFIERIDRLFARVRATPFFWRLTLFTRILLATGFIPTGLVKLLGLRFTVIAPDNPIGAFFEAMYQTGLYWRFLGASQVAAGLLLLVPRWAHLGALLFLPIMVNIFVVTVALSFTGTPVVTGLMLLAVVYLCAWDYHRIRSILTERPWPDDLVVAQPKLDRWELAGFWAFGLSLVATFLAMRGFAPMGLVRGLIVAGVLAGLFTLVRFLVAGRKLRPEAGR